MNYNGLFFRGTWSVSFSFSFSLSHDTHISQYGMVSFSLVSLQLYIQNYSPRSIQIISVPARCLQWLLHASRIKSKLLLWPMQSDTCPSTISFQTILLHYLPHYAPPMLISLLFRRHMRHDVLSTWKNQIFPHFQLKCDFSREVFPGDLI